MGLFEKIFGTWKEPTPKEIREAKEFRLINGYTPVFHTWGGELYESDRVRAAIDARARHISKLEPSTTGRAKPGLQSKLRLGPNAYETWSQFLYRTSTILDNQNTAIIVPVLDLSGEVTGIFPVPFLDCELREYAGEPWIRFKVRGDWAAIELTRVGILTKYQYRSDLFGETNAALAPTMELISLQNQGIKEGVKSSATFRFMATLSNLSNEKDIKKERDRFRNLQMQGNDSGGVLLWPSTYSNVQKIDSKPYVVDADQMKLIDENVYNYFGVNEAVLQNKAIGDAWSAFYEGAVEPFAIQASEVITKMLFSQRERELGSAFHLTSNRVQYMSTADKINYIKEMTDHGLVTVNEMRAVLNLPPLEEPLGSVIPVRGEYYNLSDKLTTGGEEDAQVNA